MLCPYEEKAEVFAGSFGTALRSSLRTSMVNRARSRGLAKKYF
jgi:hypothetical protein